MNLFDNEPDPVPPPKLTRVLNIGKKGIRVSGEILMPGETGFATAVDLARAAKLGNMLREVTDAEAAPVDE